MKVFDLYCKTSPKIYEKANDGHLYYSSRSERQRCGIFRQKRQEYKSGELDFKVFEKICVAFGIHKQRVKDSYMAQVKTHGEQMDISPFIHGSSMHTDIMKTQGLKQMLDTYKFDAVFGGARRDEEKSRAKERIYSFRDKFHRWDPKNQRPELWNIYNGRIKENESIRVFPLSNWTELDIWQYIMLENIPIPSLYFAKVRPVVEYKGAKILVDDERMPAQLRASAKDELVRFRTLGCYPLTGAISSAADTLEKIVAELLVANSGERQGRLIDSDEGSSMEAKKQEGYF